jgi:hypothetical protein
MPLEPYLPTWPLQSEENKGCYVVDGQNVVILKQCLNGKGLF